MDLQRFKERPAHTLSLNNLKEWTTRIASRHVPKDLVTQFGQRNAVEGEILVRAEIEGFFAFDGVSDFG